MVINPCQRYTQIFSSLSYDTYKHVLKKNAYLALTKMKTS